MLSNQLGNPNLQKLKEADITASRLGFVKIDYSKTDDLKPGSTYKMQFSKEQLEKTRELENKNAYARYVSTSCNHYVHSSTSDTHLPLNRINSKPPTELFF